MRRSIIGIVLSVSLLAATARASTPQDASTSKPPQTQSKDEKRIRDVKNRIRQMGVARRITVVLLNDNERYGSIEQIDEDSFQIAEVDTNQQITVFYKDVRKVRTGYGKFHPITGRRTNPKVDLLVKIGVSAFFIILIAARSPR